jgi:hypothetical protein
MADVPEKQEEAPQKESPKRGRPPKAANLPSTPVDAGEAAKLQRLQKRAQAAREMRRAAPEATATGLVTVPQKDIINRVSRDTGGQDGDWHWTFQDRRDEDRLIDLGYEPGIDPQTGKWVHYQGDPLWKLPTQDHEQMLKENSARSQAMLGTKMKADAAQTGEKVTAQRVNL